MIQSLNAQLIHSQIDIGLSVMLIHALIYIEFYVTNHKKEKNAYLLYLRLGQPSIKVKWAHMSQLIEEEGIYFERFQIFNW